MPDVLGFSCEGDVVVDELAPGHKEDCHRVVVETLVLVKIVKRSKISVSIEMKLIDNSDDDHLMKMSRDGSG